MNRIDWMHPSYRDLIIDELSKNRVFRNQFLEHANLHNLGFALSDAGGPDGMREMPLIVDNESKKIVSEKVFELSKNINDYEIWELLTILNHAIKKENLPTGWIHSMLKDVLLILHNRWIGQDISKSTLEIYCKATLFFKPLVPLPDFEPSWKATIRLLENALLDEGIILDDWTINHFSGLTELIQKNEPRFLIQIGFPKNYMELPQKIMDKLKEDFDFNLCAPSQEEIKAEINRINNLIESILDLSRIVPEWEHHFSEIIISYQKKRDELVESIHMELEPDDYDIDDSPISDPDFDIDRLFMDL